MPVKYHHHEVGGPGQSEIETPMMGLVAAGDATMLMKYIAKMTAHAHGKTVTFMPKPLYGEAGTGMHFHQHLFSGDTNIFYDPDGYGCMSQTALYYIGGLLLHGPALLGLTNPSTNSYRRLVPGFEAPVNAFFSLGNRSAAVRIPKYANQPETARMEFRPPDATCNVYLALAAQLLAGWMASSARSTRASMVSGRSTPTSSPGAKNSAPKFASCPAPWPKRCRRWRTITNFCWPAKYSPKS